VSLIEVAGDAHRATGSGTGILPILKRNQQSSRLDRECDPAMLNYLPAVTPGGGSGGTTRPD
jgi:hypothetical protein